MLTSSPEVTALVAAILPAGKLAPAAGPETLRRVGEVLEVLGPRAEPGLAGLAKLLDRAALLQTGRRFSKLPPERQQERLIAWERDPALRTALGVFSALFKTVHFDTPEVYAALGCAHKRGGPAEPARWWRQVLDGDAWPDGETVECDAVVIGTGAGGAVAGKELAERGLAVLFLEEGGFHRRDEFDGNALKAYDKLYRDRGGVFALGNSFMPVFMGRMVGGSTAINTATCWRTPPWVLEKWCEELATDEFSAAALAPRFERVERELRIETIKPEVIGGAGRVVARGCDALGWRHLPVRRNAPDCDGQGVCNFGCPTDAKRSMNITYVPRALGYGAQLVANMRARRVIIENGVAVGVEAESTGTHRKLTVRARAVVMAGGAMPTPALLLQQGIANSSGRVGHHLSLHPATSVSALMDERVEGYNAAPQSYCCDQFHRDGIFLLGASVPINSAALAFHFHGQRLVDVMDLYDRVASFGVMVEDESRGRVVVGRNGKARLLYKLSGRDATLLQRGMGYLAEIFFAAGAKRLFPLTPHIPVIENRDELMKFRATPLKPWQFILTSFHPLGTCQMGREPRTSVVDLDHETHDVKNLFLVDGSTVPGPPAVNPQLTIMAMATRAAEKIAPRLSN